MNDTKNFSEKELIDRVLQGEKPLYELLVRRYNPYLYKVGRSYNYNHEDTQDLMQETYVNVYKSLAKFEGRSSFKTWIIRIMLNNCYHKAQNMRSKKETSHEINDNAKPMFTNSNNDTAKMVRSRELKHLVEEALIQIPEDYRMVFSLREITGLKTAETASIMEISEANVKTRLSRAKSLLRKEIEKNYAPSELFDFNLIYCDAIVDRVLNEIENL